MELDRDSPSEGTKTVARRATKGLRVAIVLAVILALGSGGFFGYNAWRKSRIIIPAFIKSQISFTIFWPSKGAAVKNDKKTLKYDSAKKVLSYVSTTVSGTQLSIGEQPTPEIFNDVPQTYTQLIDSSQQYASFGSPSGLVYLTHPKEINGGQSAIFNAKGTLMFVHPTNGALSETQWKQFFNNLEIVQR